MIVVRRNPALLAYPRDPLPALHVVGRCACAFARLAAVRKSQDQRRTRTRGGARKGRHRTLRRLSVLRIDPTTATPAVCRGACIGDVANPVDRVVIGDQLARRKCRVSRAAARAHPTVEDLERGSAVGHPATHDVDRPRFPRPRRPIHPEDHVTRGFDEMRKILIGRQNLGPAEQAAKGQRAMVPSVKDVAQ